MGMNMISKGCEAAVREIQKRFKQARLVALSGNVCTDKKASAQNWVEGRGKSIVVRFTAYTKALGAQCTVYVCMCVFIIGIDRANRLTNGRTLVKGR